MKKTVFLAYVALFFCFLLPALRLDRPGPQTPAQAESPTPASPVPAAAAPAPLAGEEEPAPAPSQAPAQAAPPAPETLEVLLPDGSIETMDMQEYLTGVVAAEMPASFALEALKAQAVAARSFALYCAQGDKHGQADVCTDYACCQAWTDDAALREKWGENYDRYAQKIRSAVEETKGEYLSYEGKAVFAAFHSSSAGATEDCGAIWNPLPYLVSVSSPETAGDVPNYVSTLECAPIDFRDVILSAHPEADFSGDEAEWVGELTRDASGRVKSALLGGVAVSGTQLRSLFSLRSTAFELEYTGGSFLFTVTGFGHGVGMSQYGARVLAENGSDYAAILAHYYPGTTLSG